MSGRREPQPRMCPTHRRWFTWRCDDCEETRRAAIDRLAKWVAEHPSSATQKAKAEAVKPPPRGRPAATPAATTRKEPPGEDGWHDWDDANVVRVGWGK